MSPSAVNDMCIPATRGCVKCGAEKPLTREFFNRHSTHQYGLNNQCKACRGSAAKAARLADPEKARAKQREATRRYVERVKESATFKAKQAEQNRAWFESNRQKHAENGKRWKAANPEKARASVLKAIAANPEKYKAIQADWQRRNRDKCRAKALQYRIRHLDRVRAVEAARSARYRREKPRAIAEQRRRYYDKMKLDAGPRWIRQRISGAIRNSLLRSSARKNGRKWESLVGYSCDDLKRHVERQFTKRMSWRNWGSYWHLDHILPVSSFRFGSVDCEEFRFCWSLANLRPIPIKDNLTKSKNRTLLV